MTETRRMTPDFSSLISRIDHFSDARVLCIGDVMLDRFVYGGVERISPEAPIPVLRQSKENAMLGGAGNVVRNITSLGAECAFIGVVGNDDAGKSILQLTGELERLSPFLLIDKDRQSTEKIRYVAGNQQMLRVDREIVKPLESAQRTQLLQAVEQDIAAFPFLVLSDYGKGLLADGVAEEIIALAKAKKIPVLVDPKSRNFAVYKNAWVISPNLSELMAASGEQCANHHEIEQAARALMKHHTIANMLVTMGSEGMLLVSEDGTSHIPAQKREVFDVSGAGDSVLATLAVALASGCSLVDAAFLANEAGGIVIGKTGTAVAYRTELKTAIHTYGARRGLRKIFALDLAVEQVENWQRDGLKTGFTNGCFDIMHAGHASLLNDAKSRCDKLIVAINSDDSVRRLKGESRPVNSEMDRAMLLAELEAVDMVVIFREDTPEAILKKLKPALLMKGADYEKHQIVGADFVESYGGEVARIPLKEGYSTTATIEKMRKNG